MIVISPGGRAWRRRASAWRSSRGLGGARRRFTCAYMLVCVYIYIYIYIHIFMYTCIHMYVHMYVCMHVCMYVCMYVCIYIYIYTYISLVSVCVSLLLFYVHLFRRAKKGRGGPGRRGGGREGGALLKQVPRRLSLLRHHGTPTMAHLELPDSGLEICLS